MLTKEQKYSCLFLFTIIISLYIIFIQETAFIYDDYEQIESVNPSLSLKKIKIIFSTPHFANNLYYRPICRLAINIEQLLFGEKSWLYRLINIFLYSSVCVFSYIFTSKFLSNINNYILILLTLCIAFHPIAAQSIYIITCQEVLFLLFFSFISCYCFYKNKIKLSALFFYLALLCRENAIIIPAIIFIYLWIVEKQPFKLILKKMSFFIIISLIYLVQRFFIITSSRIGKGIPSFTEPILGYLFMFQSCLFPSFNFIYEPDLLIWASYYTTIPTILVIFCSIYYFLKQNFEIKNIKLIKLLLLWIFLMYLPTANFLKQDTPYACRHCMAILPTLIVLIAIIYQNILKKYVKTSILVLLFILLSFSYTSYKFSIYFKSDLDFAIQWLKTSPYSRDAIRFGGMTFLRNNKLKEAEILFKEGIKNYFDNDMYNNLAILYQTQKKYNEAEIYLFEILKRNPQIYDIQFNYGLNCYNQNRFLESFSRFCYVKSCLETEESNKYIEDRIDFLISYSWYYSLFQFIFP